MKIRILLAAAISIAVTSLTTLLQADAPIRTQWADKVLPENVLPEYPRPQMVRDDWINLNGHWEYAVAPRGSAKPTSWTGKILVPFCIESDLSGVGKLVGPENELWYRRTIRRLERWESKRVLLHFGAVDWLTDVYVNDHHVGQHQGGYDAFTFDITDYLIDGESELVVRVWDPTDAGYQPRGKQIRNPNVIWYTAVTGIWQTVWLESVPQTSIESLRINVDFEGDKVRVDVNTRGRSEKLKLVMKASIDGAEHRVSAAVGEPLILNPKSTIPAWTPRNPTLHRFTIGLQDDSGKTVDHVESYFGFRKIEIKKDKDGVNRLFLNNTPYFQYGTLDQGWWPDGLYTAPTDEALKYDLEITKQLGFNMIRKHVKVEPARWYYWCDTLGLVVWQDMPSGDNYINGDMPDITRTAQSGFNYERELRAMMDGLYNHPCIVMWVPYNEGWGQWDTGRITNLIKQLDPTRLVNSASGWTDRQTGDVLDIHSYPSPRVPALEENRAVVVGEFGGLGLPIKGHLWQQNDNWGYRTYESQESLTDAYCNMLGHLHRLVGQGLSAAVYTQTTDVEGEVNGLMTYDRKVIKLDEQKAAAAANKLYLDPPKITTILPTSAESGASWRYTFAKPDEDWANPSYEDSSWKTGKGGFGTDGTPGAKIGTNWNTTDIWLRRTFGLNAIPSKIELNIHHDEDAKVYFNGRLVAELSGYTTGYVPVPLKGKTAEFLKRRENVIAIHCKQSTGGQFIDAGLIAIEEAEVQQNN